MPCDGSYMNPYDTEIELSRAYCLWEELVAGNKINKDEWRGYHPKAYNNFSKAKLDEAVRALCEKLSAMSKEEISKYSLELQIWWRDHQEADRQRERNEREAQANEKLRVAALQKLTPVEKKALGV